MTAPHKATLEQWVAIRMMGSPIDNPSDKVTSLDLKYLSSCLLEVAYRLAKLEKATQPPPPAADHFRGATGMVATDEELEKYWIKMRDSGPAFVDAVRAVYNLGRQHAAQPRQEGDPSQLSASDVVSRLMEWAAHPGQEGPPSTPPPAPAGGLVEEISRQVPLRPVEIRSVIRLIADWLDTRGNNGSAAELRREADR